MIKKIIFIILSTVLFTNCTVTKIVDGGEPEQVSILTMLTGVDENNKDIKDNNPYKKIGMGAKEYENPLIDYTDSQKEVLDAILGRKLESKTGLKGFSIYPQFIELNLIGLVKGKTDVYRVFFENSQRGEGINFMEAKFLEDTKMNIGGVTFPEKNFKKSGENILKKDFDKVKDINGTEIYLRIKDSQYPNAISINKLKNQVSLQINLIKMREENFEEIKKYLLVTGVLEMNEINEVEKLFMNYLR